MFHRQRKVQEDCTCKDGSLLAVTGTTGEFEPRIPAFRRRDEAEKAGKRGKWAYARTGGMVLKYICTVRRDTVSDGCTYLPVVTASALASRRKATAIPSLYRRPPDAPSSCYRYTSTIIAGGHAMVVSRKRPRRPLLPPREP